MLSGRMGERVTPIAPTLDYDVVAFFFGETVCGCAVLDAIADYVR